VFDGSALGTGQLGLPTAKGTASGPGWRTRLVWRNR
jgi:hypothetical protein